MNKFLLLIVLVFIFVATIFRGQFDSYFSTWRHLPKNSGDELLSDDYIKRITSQDGHFDSKADTGIWYNKKVPVPALELAALINQPNNVLGIFSGYKWIEVDLTTQHLYAREGDRIAFDFPISSGMPWTPTVTGEFSIWAKVKAQRMKGGSIADGSYYDLPNVAFVQYFHGGYGLHGAYWHNDFGKPRSHGCVNISNENAKRLFEWTDPQLAEHEYARYNLKPEEATRVVIHGTTPTNVN